MEGQYKEFVFANSKKNHNPMRVEGNVIYERKNIKKGTNFTIYQENINDNSMNIRTYSFLKNGDNNLHILEVSGSHNEVTTYTDSLREQLESNNFTTAIYRGKQLDNKITRVKPHKNSGLVKRIKIIPQEDLKQMAETFVNYQ